MSLDITEIPETELQPEEVEEQIEEVAPIEDVEVADIEETPVPKKRGRPAGAKNKPKPKPVYREIPMNTPEPQVDMHALTNMLAQHLASEKAQARQRRQANWSGFF